MLVWLLVVAAESGVAVTSLATFSLFVFSLSTRVVAVERVAGKNRNQTLVLTVFELTVASVAAGVIVLKDV